MKKSKLLANTILILCSIVQAFVVKNNYNLIFSQESFVSIIMNFTPAFVFFIILQYFLYLLLINIYKSIYFNITYDDDKNKESFNTIVSTSFFIFVLSGIIYLFYYYNDLDSYSVFMFGPEMDGKNNMAPFIAIGIAFLQGIFIYFAYTHKKAKFQFNFSRLLLIIIMLEVVHLPGIISKFLK